MRRRELCFGPFSNPLGLSPLLLTKMNRSRLDYCRADTQCINDGYQYHAVAKANFVWSIATTAPNQRVDIGDDAAAGSSDSGLSTQ